MQKKALSLFMSSSLQLTKIKIWNCNCLYNCQIVQCSQAMYRRQVFENVFSLRFRVQFEVLQTRTGS